VSRQPFFLSLGPHEFLWFSLELPADDALAAPLSPAELPVLPPVMSPTELLDGGTAGELMRILTRWTRQRRWFRGKARRIKDTRIRDVIPAVGCDDAVVVLVVDVEYTEGDPDAYLVPIATSPAGVAARLLDELPAAGLARLRSGDARRDAGYLVDATVLPSFPAALLASIGGRRRWRGRRGELVARPEPGFRSAIGTADLAPTPIRSEQSNSSTVLGDRAILKLYRTVVAGTNPDLEVGRFLTEHDFEHTPRVLGSIDYREPRGQAATAGILQEFVPNQGDLFEFTLDTLRSYFERVLAIATAPEPGALDSASLLAATHAEPPLLASETVGAYLETAHLLGTRTGELHRALASDASDAAFAPEPFTELYQRSIYQAIQATTRQSLRMLERAEPPAEPAATTAGRVLAASGGLDRRLRSLFARRLDGQRIRIHGDYHLGQVLHTGRDLLIIDFEGEPARPLGERRLKRSPLVDVAGMLRSFHYAAFGSLLRPELGAEIRPEDVSRVEPWTAFWYRSVAVAFLTGYGEATRGQPFLPAADEDRGILLDAFLLQKAAYEIAYELNNRPDWVSIPLHGILELLDR
jgi:maltose alpha-D-glucosyltransferase/alpha-amylase